MHINIQISNHKIANKNWIIGFEQKSPYNTQIMISYFTIVFYCRNVHILQINVNCFVKGQSVLVSFNELKKIMCIDAAFVEMHQWDWLH